jgi:hypothetical protein
MSDRRWEKWPVMTEIVEGDPIHAEGRELTPVVRVTSHVRRQALVGNEGDAGQGRGFVHMRPVAILDSGDSGLQRLSTHDWTTRSTRRLLLVAFLVPCIAAMLIYLSRRS